MTEALRYRRLPGYGWSIETAEGDLRSVRRDDGSVASAAGGYVGTREAADLIGVRPPNFVRDWAARPDFPAPVATLSSGRVWLAAEVAEYATARRAQKSSLVRMCEIATRIVWWQKPETTLARPLDLAARVMATGTLEETRDVERYLGRAAMREALVDAAPGVFDARAWNYWRLVFGLDRAMPLPARRVP